MQIVPGVFLVNGFPYGQHQNGYVVKAEGATVMIDSGDLATETFELVLANCRRWGIDLSQISHLLVTHAHFDHSSHAARLQQRGVQIIAGQDAAEAMACGDDRCIGFAVQRTYEPCKVDRVVRDGEALSIGGPAIRCIAAPGHANSCMVYEAVLNDQRLWFVGDVILTGPECQSVELGWSGGPDYDRSAYVQTLAKLSRMDCDSLLPGHGPPCIGDGKRLVEMACKKARNDCA